MKTAIGCLIGIAYSAVGLRADAQTAIPNISDGVVFIRLLDEHNSEITRGSGFLIGGNGFIMTSNHLFENFDPSKDKITVSLRSRDAAPIAARTFKCKGQDTGNFDGCLLFINSTNVKNAGIKDYFKLDCNFPAQGDALLAAGYPVGDYSPLVVVQGTVSASGPGDLFKYYMTAPVLPGMSGGPIFDSTGNVLGISYGQAKVDNNMISLYFFTPLAYLIDLVLYTQLQCPTTASSVPSPPSTGQPAPGDQGLPSKVYFQISGPSQEASAKAAINALSKDGFKTAPQIEVVGKEAPSSAQIRYFSDEDKAAAQAVQVKLESTGKQHFGLAKLQGLKAPKGVVEVWYPDKL